MNLSPQKDNLQKPTKYLEDYMTLDVTYQNNKNTRSKRNLEENEKGKLIKDFIKNLSEEQKMKFWIKTLLSSQKTFPEIIKTLDRIIELQASSVSFASSIYNLENPTFKQVEKVIDLSERKTFLLNIYLMSKELTKGLSSTDSEFLEKKFVYNLSVETLAKEFDISPRTVYRKTNKLIDEIYAKITRKNWSLKFLESQIKNEFWLKSRFISQVTDYVRNTNILSNNQSKSSSES